jgi:hypothetical protein
MPFDFAVPPQGQDQFSPAHDRIAAAFGGWYPLAAAPARSGVAAVVQYFLCGLGIRGA